MPGQRSWLRAVVRLTTLSAHILLGVGLVAALRLSLGQRWFNSRQGKAIVQWWARTVCRILVIRVRQRGAASIVKNTLYVANHISWIDIIAIGSVVQTKFISKHTVRHWPVIGTLVAASGTVFIDRGKHFALNRAIATVRAELDQQHAMLIFPEGTTTDGWNMARFYPGLFSVLKDSRHVIQPLALRYVRDGKLDMLAPYIGEDNFVAHLFRIAAVTETCLELQFGSVIAAGNRGRHELAAVTHAEIMTMLMTGRDVAAIPQRRVA